MARFLIVDDDSACRRLVQAYLAAYGQCDLACDGEEALQAFRRGLESGAPYDLICLDIMMPGIDGHAVLDAVRVMERQRGICGNDGVKVIMATALTDTKHCIRAFSEGCDDFLSKPVKENALVEHVQELLGGLLPEMAPTAANPASSTGPSAGSEPDNSSRPHFLIADDDAVCRELMKDILSPYGRCDFAYDGTEAVDAVRLALEDGDYYDLICLDIMMPGSSGHEVLEMVRRLEAEHGILGSDSVRVIMTTALRDSKHCVRAFREGCESYITKPIDQKKLLTKMQELGLSVLISSGS
jgi:two-component system, chemotaxis family, chemotaxis protein CheY